MSKKASLHVYITQELHDKLRAAAKEVGYTLSTYVAILIRRDLEGDKKPDSDDDNKS